MSAPDPVPVMEMRGVAATAMRDPERPVVEAVDWRVAPGDFWVVAGLHGAGKSDFLALAAGLTAPVAGEYWLFGERMPIFEGSRLATRLRLGMVFDGGQLFQHLTVAETSPCRSATMKTSRSPRPPTACGNSWHGLNWRIAPTGCRGSCRAPNSAAPAWPAP